MMSVRNAVRGALSAGLLYPLFQRISGRQVSPKTKWIQSHFRRSADDRQSLARQQLVLTLQHAGAHVPYYRDLFTRLNFDPDQVSRDPGYLNELPFLTKDIIREQGDRLCDETQAAAKFHVTSTSGSTGTSVKIRYDQEAADWASATVRACRAAIGNPHWRSEVHFASYFPEKFPLRDRLREASKCLAMNRDNVFFKSFDAEELDAIWQRLKSLKPHLVHAHPSTMDQLAAHIEMAGGTQALFSIFESSGEVLSDAQRARIGRVLGGTVINRYGLAEAGVVAYQISPDRAEMDWLDFVAWPEIATAPDTARSVATGETATGELVITNLQNRKMPLIRYCVGDIATLDHSSGKLALIQLVGRSHDVVRIGETELPTHYIQDVLDRVGGISEFQINDSGALPRLRIVLAPEASPDSITQRIQDWWPDQVEVEFITADQLELTGPQQKFRHLIKVGNQRDRS